MGNQIPLQVIPRMPQEAETCHHPLIASWVWGRARIKGTPLYQILLLHALAKRMTYPGVCTADMLISLEAFGDYAQILSKAAP